MQSLHSAEGGVALPVADVMQQGGLSQGKSPNLCIVKKSCLEKVLAKKKKKRGSQAQSCILGSI